MNTPERTPQPEESNFDLEALFPRSLPISSLEFVRVALTEVVPEQYQISNGYELAEDAFERVQKYGFDDGLNDDIGRKEVAEFRRQFLDALITYEEYDYENVEADPDVVDSINKFIEQFEEQERLDRMSLEAYQVALRMLFVTLEPQRFSEFT